MATEKQGSGRDAWWCAFCEKAWPREQGDDEIMSCGMCQKKLTKVTLAKEPVWGLTNDETIGPQPTLPVTLPGEVEELLEELSQGLSLLNDHWRKYSRFSRGHLAQAQKCANRLRALYAGLAVCLPVKREKIPGTVLLPGDWPTFTVTGEHFSVKFSRQGISDRCQVVFHSLHTATEEQLT